MKKAIIAALAFGSLFMSDHGYAADSTSLANSSKLSSVVDKGDASGGDFPIGSVVYWAFGTPPDDGNWLECNGQTVDAKKYPEFVAKFGTKTPDYSGLFLRGRGGNAAALNTLQAETVKLPDISQNVHLAGLAKGGYYGEYERQVFSHWGGAGAHEVKIPHYNTYKSEYPLKFRTGNANNTIGVGDETLEIPIEINSPAGETRPVNKSVVYFIRVQ